MNENDYKQHIRDRLSDTFHIAEEVKGKHLIYGDTVIADFILRPKPSAIKLGFDDVYFVIETKVPADDKSKFRKTVYQTISYTQSIFGNGVQPSAGFFYPGFRAWWGSDYLEDKSNGMHEIMRFATYFNVGDIEFHYPEDKPYKRSLPYYQFHVGWQRFYRSDRGRTKNNVLKKRSGNIS